MTVSTSPYALPAASGPTRPASAPAAPAALTEAEQAGIAAAFPARPEVVHRLYGPSREVQAPPQLGANLDLSA